MESLWRATVKLPEFEPLHGDCKTDVLIVGGGLAGILCAYMLRGAGVDCLLTEAATICSGVTGGTTAKITAQHGLIYEKLAKRFGMEAARMYLEANQAAVEKYRAICGGIDCDFQEQDNYVYTLDDLQKLEREAGILEKLGAPAKIETQTSLPFPVAGALRFEKQAQFNPLHFVAEIANGLPIFENTKVLELMPGAAVTNRGTVRAEKTIIATHFPILNKHGGYFLKLYQNRSYVLALQGAPVIQGMYIDEAEDGFSFRQYKQYLLLGSGGKRTGKPTGGWHELTGFAVKTMPGAREVYRWAAQDCMSLDGIPYIGRYSPKTQGIYVATGFNKWGMTGAMVAAGILTDLVQGKENIYVKLFDPARSMLHPQLAENALEAAISLATPTVPRCPHMGCALKYNAQERSWDCPCHGSRFSESGKLLDNPATDDKKM